MLRIKEILKEKGISQVELADRLGVTRISVAKTISGNPTIDTLQKIATAINVDIVDLIEKRISSHFSAIIEYKGELKKFTSVEELKKFIENLEE